MNSVISKNFQNDDGLTCYKTNLVQPSKKQDFLSQFKLSRNIYNQSSYIITFETRVKLLTWKKTQPEQDIAFS